MLWFKHRSDARNSLKLRKVRRKYGADGYAIYWFCLEAIAYDVDKDNLTFELKEDAETIAFELTIQEKRVEEIMLYMIKVGLFESSSNMITCMKLAESIDKSMTNSPKMRAWLDGKSVMTSPDDAKACAELEVEVDKSRIEEEKTLKQLARKTLIDDAFNFFWLNMSLSKKAKPKAISAFSKAITKMKIDDPMHFAQHLVNDTKTRFDNQQIGFDKMHPTTYLNGQRWEDDYTVDKSPESNKAQMNSTDTSWVDLQDDML